MQRYGLTADSAFAVLRRYSQQRNTKLVVLAEQITTTGELPTQPRPLQDPRVEARTRQIRIRSVPVTITERVAECVFRTSSFIEPWEIRDDVTDMDAVETGEMGYLTSSADRRRRPRPGGSEQKDRAARRPRCAGV